MLDKLPPIARLLRIFWRRRGARHAASQLSLLRNRLAVLSGAVLLGLIALAFAKASDAAQLIFADWIVHRPLLPLVFTPAIFALVVLLTRFYMPDARGSGIPQVIAASKQRDTIASRVLVAPGTATTKFGLTALMLLGGASVGREGPTVQISAAVMVWVHRLLRVPITAGVLIAGGAAGVAAAFNTPLAGVAFAIEELASAYEQKVTMIVMGAVMISGFVSLGIAGDYIYFGSMGQTLSLHTVLLVVPLVGLIGGLAGGLFSRIVLTFSASTHPALALPKRRPILFATGCGLLVALLGIASGTTWGTGYGVTKLMVEGHDQSPWFGAAKFMATLATTLAGAPGGIFAPSLSVGAGIGNLVSPLFDGNATGAIAVLGMAAYLVGVVRAPLTGVIIVSETTASRGILLPLFATALIADGVSAFICRERLYHGLSKAFLPDQSKPAAPCAGTIPA